MLGEIDAAANVAVKNLAMAQDFYETVLGLTPIDWMGGDVVVYASGATRLNVYVSDMAGSNKATAVTWAVGDRLEPIVAALLAKGVAFERYDMPGGVRDGDIHTFGHIKVAWFKDPDGNILNLVSA